MSEHFPVGLPTPTPAVVDPATGPYWDAAGEGDLVLPWCRACRRTFWYPRGFCPRCGGEDLEWRAPAGVMHVYSWTVVRRAGGPWSEHLPFVLAHVEVDDDVVVQANLVDVDAADLAVGLTVTPVFERAADSDLPVLRFRPVQA